MASKYVRPSQRTERLGDDAAWAAWLSDISILEHKQLPFALSLATNDVLFAARKLIVSDYDSKYGGGLQNLKRTLKIEKSHKEDHPIGGTIGEATGYMGQQQWGFHKQATHGGQMAMPSKYLLSIAKTKSGKIKKSHWPKRILRGYNGPVQAGKRGGKAKYMGGKDPVFPIVSGQHKMIVTRDRAAQRQPNGRYANSQFKILYFYVDTAKVKKRWAFDTLVMNEARHLFPQRLTRRLAQAIRTAK